MDSSPKLAVSCNETECFDPSHLRVAALRLQGKRWSEIAATLGVTTVTIWRWREECPQIAANISAESLDYAESTRLRFIGMLPKVASAVSEVLDEGTPFERIAAAKLVVEIMKREGPPPTPGELVERVKALAAVPDDDLDAKLVAPNVLARAKSR